MRDNIKPVKTYTDNSGNWFVEFKQKELINLLEKNNTDTYVSQKKSIHAKESDKDIKQFINALKKYKRKNGTKKRS